MGLRNDGAEGGFDWLGVGGGKGTKPLKGGRERL